MSNKQYLLAASMAVFAFFAVSPVLKAQTCGEATCLDPATLAEGGTAADGVLCVNDFTDSEEECAAVSDEGSNCSLRAALTKANELSGDVTICLMTGAEAATINLDNPLIVNPAGDIVDAGEPEGEAEASLSESTLTITTHDAHVNIQPTEGREIQLFMVDEGRRVVVQRLNFANGSVASEATGEGGKNGGCIYNKGNLTIHEADFTNCHATDRARGGAIFSIGALTINKASFTNNSGYSGGAILQRDGEFNVSQSYFGENRLASIEGNGGAIYLADSAAEIHNSTFFGNVAGVIAEDGSIGDLNEGGAIYFYASDDTKVANLSHLTFVHNRASSGSAFFNPPVISKYEVEVANSIFLNLDGDGDDCGGSAIYSLGFNYWNTGCGEIDRTSRARGSDILPESLGGSFFPLTLGDLFVDLEITEGLFLYQQSFRAEDGFASDTEGEEIDFRDNLGYLIKAIPAEHCLEQDQLGSDRFATTTSEGETEPAEGARCTPGSIERVCGDGVVQFGEACDDGNRLNGDGCSRDCRVNYDQDGDGYLNSAYDPEAFGDPASPFQIGDCDDTRADVNPGVTECVTVASSGSDGLDNNCDGEIDNVTLYRDLDEDGFGDAAFVSLSCSGLEEGYVFESGDCNDEDAERYPGATEICDSIDNDCDGEVDNNLAEGEGAIYYPDLDGDGFGNPLEPTARLCVQPENYTVNSSDCNDDPENGGADIQPGAREICDGLDNNCDGSIDTDLAPGEGIVFYPDADDDGYGVAGGEILIACSAPANYATEVNDCDDTEANANPGATEVCDEIDNNCDFQIDEAAVCAVENPDGEQPDDQENPDTGNPSGNTADSGGGCSLDTSNQSQKTATSFAFFIAALFLIGLVVRFQKGTRLKV